MGNIDKIIKRVLHEHFNESKISWDDYVKSQFDDTEHRHLPSDYFEPFKVKENTKDNFPILIDVINGLEYRKWIYGGIGVFDGDKEVAHGDNSAIVVSPEYQRRGIGLELVSLLKSMNPTHRFGSMTPRGWSLMRSYYDRRV